MFQVEINNILSEDEAAAHIKEIFEKVATDDESFIITQNDRPVIGIVNIEQLEGDGVAQPAVQSPRPTLSEEPELPDFPDAPVSTPPTANPTVPQNVSNNYPVSGSPLDDDLPDLDQPPIPTNQVEATPPINPVPQMNPTPPINPVPQMNPVQPMTPPAPTTPSPLTQKDLPDYPEVPDMPV